MEPAYSDVKTLAALPEANTLGDRVRWAYGELEKSGLPIDFEVAKRFPLITYSTKKGDDAITAAAAVAVGWGIPKEIVWAYAIDIDPRNKNELEWLGSRAWETLWNGVWIILGCDSTDKDDFFSRDGSMVLYLGGQGGESAWEDAEQILTVAKPIISHDQFRYGVVGANDWCGAFQKTIAAKVKETTGKPYPFIGSADRVVIDTKSSIGSMVAGARHLTPDMAEKLARGEPTDSAWSIVA